MSAVAAGFSEGRLSGAVRGAVQIRLQPAAPRTLLALDSQGQPVAGALITAVESGRPLGITGADGRLRVDAGPGAGLRLAVQTQDGRRALAMVPAQEGGRPCR